MRVNLAVLNSSLCFYLTVCTRKGLRLVSLVYTNTYGQALELIEAHSGRTYFRPSGDKLTWVRAGARVQDTKLPAASTGTS